MAEETGWQYKPDGDEDADGGAADTSSGKSASSKSTRRKNESYSWTASEYIDHKQGPAWFISLTLVTVILAALIFLLTKDYVALVVILALGLSVGIFAKRTPQQLTYELSSGSVKIGAKEYPYRLFKSFSIINDGALVSLNLEPIKRFMLPVSIYFDPADHEKIFGILEDRLPYEDRQLDAVERLSRRLRF